MRTLLTAAVLTVAAIAGFPTVASADPAANDDFGRRLSACTQEHGFNDTDNPGTHQGRSGWDGSSC